MAQDVEFVCPRCERLLAIDADYAGRMGKCPYCDEQFMIPSDHVVLLKPASSWNRAMGGTTTAGAPPQGHVYFMNNKDEYRNFAWRRWAARCIDSWIGYCIVMALFSKLAYLSAATGVGVQFWEWIAEPNHRWFDYVLTTLLVFFSDALVYSVFKTTLGKRINGIRVCDVLGHRIGRVDFLLRDVDVLLRGAWLCFPFLNMIACILQYQRVCKGEPTSYDRGCAYQARPTRGKSAYDLVVVILAVVIGGVVMVALK